jgi:hypothetical protein
MATNHTTTPPTNTALAARLVDHADSITNHAAHELEQDMRLAAKRLAEAGDCGPTPLVVALITELRQISHESRDLSVAAKLDALMGEFAA